MTVKIDPVVKARMDDPFAPKLKSKYMMSLVVIAKPKTWVYAIVTRDTHDVLGKVYWYGMTYIFEPPNDPRYRTRFYDSCLQSITDFIHDLKEERKRNRLCFRCKVEKASIGGWCSECNKIEAQERKARRSSTE